MSPMEKYYYDAGYQDGWRVRNSRIHMEIAAFSVGLFIGLMAGIWIGRLLP